MPRNRTIYNTQALYVSQVPATEMQTGRSDIKQLSRIQNFDEDFVRNYTNIFQYGTLGPLGVLETEDPTVSANFSYYLTNGWNEKLLGLEVYPNESPDNYYIGGYIFPSGFPILKNEIKSCISNFVTKTADEKNYYLLVTEEGNDAVGYNGLKSGVIGIGNGYITSYTVSAAVGDIPTAEVEIEGLNVRVYDNQLLKDFVEIDRFTGINANMCKFFPSGVFAFSTRPILLVSNPYFISGSNTFGVVNVYTGNSSKNKWGLAKSIGGYIGTVFTHPSFGTIFDSNSTTNLVAIGAPTDIGGYGTVSIFDTSLGSSFLQGFTGLSNQEFGRSIVMSKSNLSYVGGYNRLAVGAKGYVNIYTGIMIDRNISLYQSITGSQLNFGQSLAASDYLDVLAIGDDYSFGTTGAVFLYTGSITTASNWVLKQTITGLGSNLRFGNNISMNANGSIIVIGGYNATNAYIYTGNSIGGWNLRQTIPTTSDPVSISRDGQFIGIGLNLNTTIFSGTPTDGWVLFDTIPDIGRSSFILQNNTIEFDYPNIALGRYTANSSDKFSIYSFTEFLPEKVVPSINYTNGANLNNKFFNLPAAQSITGGIDIIYPWAIGGYVGGYRETSNIPISINNTTNKIPSVLLPGDIVFNIPESGTLGFDSNDLKIQDFTLSLDLARTPVKRIGNRFSLSREINFPATATLEINAEIGDLSNDNLVDFLCNEKLKDFNISIKTPGCFIGGYNPFIGGYITEKSTALTYLFKNARLVSQNISATIGENGTINATYEVPLGGPTNTDRGVFISGSYVDKCPITGNTPWLRHSLYNQGGIQFPISGQFTGLTDTLNTYQYSNFVAQNPVTRRIQPLSSTWEGISNIFTGWNPNTGFINVGSGGYVEILTTGIWAGFGVEWWSSNKLPSQLSLPEKGWTQTRNFTNIFLQQQGPTISQSSQTLRSTSASTVPYIGYLPLEHNYLYFRLNPSAGGGSIFITATTSSGYYNSTDSENGACYQEFTQPAIPSQNIIQFFDYTGVYTTTNLLIRYNSGIVAVNINDINNGVPLIIQSNTNYSL